MAAQSAIAAHVMSSPGFHPCCTAMNFVSMPVKVMMTTSACISPGVIFYKTNVGRSLMAWSFLAHLAHMVRFCPCPQLLPLVPLGQLPQYGQTVHAIQRQILEIEGHQFKDQRNADG